MLHASHARRHHAIERDSIGAFQRDEDSNAVPDAYRAEERRHSRHLDRQAVRGAAPLCACASRGDCRAGIAVAHAEGVECAATAFAGTFAVQAMFESTVELSRLPSSYRQQLEATEVCRSAPITQRALRLRVQFFASPLSAEARESAAYKMRNLTTASWALSHRFVGRCAGNTSQRSLQFVQLRLQLPSQIDLRAQVQELVALRAAVRSCPLPNRQASSTSSALSTCLPVKTK